MAHTIKLVFARQNLEVISVSHECTNIIAIEQYQPAVVLLHIRQRPEYELYLLQLLQIQQCCDNVICFGSIKPDRIGKLYKPLELLTYIPLPVSWEHLALTVLKSLQDDPKVELGSEQKKNISLMGIVQNPQLSAEQKCEKLGDRIISHLAFPFTVLQILSIVDQQDTGAPQLAKVIEADPLLSAQVVGLAGSLGAESVRTHSLSIQECVVRLGFQRVKRLAVTALIVDLFAKVPATGVGFDRVEFWRYAVSCAHTAEILARRSSLVDAQRAYMAGLLQGIGVLLLDSFFPSLFSAVVKQTIETAGRFDQVAVALLGFSAAEFTATILRRWGFDEQFTGAIAQSAGVDVRAAESADDLAAIISFSQTVVTTLGLGRAGDCFVRTPSNQLCRRLALGSQAQMQHFLGAVEQAVLPIWEQFGLEISPEKSMVPQSNEQAPKVAWVDAENLLFDPFVHYLKLRGYSVAEVDSLDKVPPECKVVFIRQQKASTRIIRGLGQEVQAVWIASESGGSRSVQDAMDLRLLRMLVVQLFYGRLVSVLPGSNEKLQPLWPSLEQKLSAL